MSESLPFCVIFINFTVKFLPNIYFDIIFSCPPGFDTSRVVEIGCLCSNGTCLFQNRNSDDNRFQIEGMYIMKDHNISFNIWSAR